MPQTRPRASGTSVDSKAVPRLPMSLPDRPLFKVYCAKTGISPSVSRKPSTEMRMDHRITTELSSSSSLSRQATLGSSG
eukprot:CAMPEP_0173251324 /NCGR_PEP_ID=MMETSP1142-20121109/20088_1 /TAXON_ID=483371 /ORGANISM="non described non described, Strain CCMP2298" /LENGTH=78 /DNA_ID=CAMNT_0014184203 /DNA_START=435 /DNA_END=667 /DNA_ORIENTATION=-